MADLNFVKKERHNILHQWSQEAALTESYATQRLDRLLLHNIP